MTVSRFHESTLTPTRYRGAKTPTDILANIVEREISVSSVVSDRVFVSSEQASDVIKILSQAAVKLGLSQIVMELGQAEALGTYDDPLEDIPEVIPVRVIAKVCIFHLLKLRQKVADDHDRKQSHPRNRRT